MNIKFILGKGQHSIGLLHIFNVLMLRTASVARVSIVIRLWAGQLENQFDLEGDKDFSLYHSVHVSSVVHPFS